MYYPSNCTSVFWPLELSIIKCFKQFYSKHVVLIAVRLMDSGQGIKLKINVFQQTHFTVAALTALGHVMQLTFINCFLQCSYGHKFNTEADSNLSTGKQDNAFHAEWIWLGI